MGADILCIGAAHVDRKAYVKTEVRLQTSIPVTTQATLGGVARNVAENAARLGCNAALLSRVGRIAAATLTVECVETVDPLLTPQRLEEKLTPDKQQPTR